jgi:uncharacterized protein YjbJ (UPF0337 family)
MARHRLTGAWSQIKEQAKEHWGQLPNDIFDEVECRRDGLARLIQERYGVERDEADRQIDQWINGAVRAEV